MVNEKSLKNLKPSARRGKAQRAPRPTAADKGKRTNTIMTMLLSGARRGEICEFMRETWGISSGQADRYIHDAHELIKVEASKAREENFTEQAALRRMLRKRAIGDGDLRLALDVAKDEAKLHDLYPSEKYDVTASVAVKGYMGISPDDWDSVNDSGTGSTGT